MYRVKGADQKEYGPVTADQVRLWIQEGRLNRFSQLQKEGEAVWKSLEQFPEFSDLLTAAPSLSAQPGSVPGAGAVPAAFPVVADPQRATDMLKAPALCLLLLGGFGVLVSVAGLFLKGAWINWLMNSGIPLDGSVRAQLDQLRAAGLGITDFLGTAVGLAINVLIIVGALKMQRLQSWGLGLASAILVMLPCSLGCCCIVGLPVGIWAVVVLNKPEVKGAFR
jgi:hypothetical protein